jgi:phosphoribosylanthranilate isomerase
LEDYPSKKPFFLSGGIGPESIAAIKKLQNTPLPLHAIDVNSKFETAAGVKNIPLLQQFKKECNVV